jgi:hypothetical protein
VAGQEEAGTTTGPIVGMGVVSAIISDLRVVEQGGTVEKIDPYVFSLDQLFVEAAMFRIQQAYPSAADSITILRHVFDRLVAVVEAASHANTLGPTEQLTAHTEDGKYIVSLASKFVAGIHSEGRTLLEAIVRAKWEMQVRIEGLLRYPM